MKTILSVILLAISLGQLKAQVFVSPQGKVHFHSNTPLEDIDATSSEGSCLINTATKHVTAKVEMKSFVFPKPLMQEHFNENYVESDKFPNAVLEADIASPVDFKKDGTYKVTLKGTFEIHGVKKPYTIPGTLIVKGGVPYGATAAFDVKLADHNIKIPTAVIMKIAEVIKVDVNFIFNKNNNK